jgi:hypothetical protein
MKPLYDHLVLDMVNSSVPLLVRRGEPSKLCHSAAHLLVTLTGTVRPPQIWELHPIKDMYHMATSLTYLLPEVCITSLNNFISITEGSIMSEEDIVLIE